MPPPPSSGDETSDGPEANGVQSSEPQTFNDRSVSSDTSKPETRLQPGLYIVATPIGNAADITLRALDILRGADVIACEDTRVTRKLLNIHGIAAGKLISYHDHNAEASGSGIIELLNSGEIVALVSDAGTPLINDPGYGLVTLARGAGHTIHAAPGPSSVINALVLAGLPTDRFLYAGFPPPKSAKRRTWLGEIRNVPSTLVFLESPSRLADALADMADILGPRPASVLREMTKMFEEVRTGTLGELAAHYKDATTPKGEITLVVGPPGAESETEIDLDARLAEALKTESVREASARVALETGLSKREVYNRALALKPGKRR